MKMSVYNRGMENYDVEYWKQPCPKLECAKGDCKYGLKYVNIPTVLGDDSANSTVAPKNGNYCNSIVQYEANGAVYIYSREGVPVKVKEGTNAA